MKNPNIFQHSDFMTICFHMGEIKYRSWDDFQFGEIKPKLKSIETLDRFDFPLHYGDERRDKKKSKK